MPLPKWQSVYTSNTAFFSHYYHVCDFAPALILASLLCLRKKQVWHSYCTEVLSSLREWVCNDAATRAQKSGHVPAQSKVCLEATCSEKYLQAVQMPSWRWVLRTGSQPCWESALCWCTSMKYSLIVEQFWAEIIFPVWDSLYTSFINTGILCNQRPAPQNSWIHFGLTRGMGIFYIYLWLLWTFKMLFINIKNNQGFWKEFILHYHHLQEFFHLPLEYV